MSLGPIYLVGASIFLIVGMVSTFFEAQPIVFWSCLIASQVLTVGSGIISTIEKNAK